MGCLAYATMVYSDRSTIDVEPCCRWRRKGLSSLHYKRPDREASGIVGLDD